MARPDTSQIKSLTDSARSIHILLPQRPSFDQVASSLALKLVLEATGKSTMVVCSDPMTVEFNTLVGVDTITTSLGGRNLLITFPGQTEHVDKVSYNLENGELQLVITPKPQSPDLDHRMLKFVSGQSKSDLAILMGVSQLSDLGDLFSAKDFLAQSPLVAFSHHPPIEAYTPHLLYGPDASSLSELIFHIVESLGFIHTPDAATNLLSGMEVATQNFKSPIVSVSTFETAAILLRRGARRHQAFDGGQLPPGAIPTAPSPVVPTTSTAPAPIPSTQLGYGSDSQTVTSEATPAPAKPPSPDWYEPKIFQGSMVS